MSTQPLLVVCHPCLPSHCAGYQPDPLYEQYSSEFFDGQHYTLRGASPATHPAIARRSFRNFYQRLYPFVFAKFRLARSRSSAGCDAAAR